MLRASPEPPTASSSLPTGCSRQLGCTGEPRHRPRDSPEMAVSVKGPAIPGGTHYDIGRIRKQPSWRAGARRVVAQRAGTKFNAPLFTVRVSLSCVRTSDSRLRVRTVCAPGIPAPAVGEFSVRRKPPTGSGTWARGRVQRRVAGGHRPDLQQQPGVPGPGGELAGAHDVQADRFLGDDVGSGVEGLLDEVLVYAGGDHQEVGVAAGSSPNGGCLSWSCPLPARTLQGARDYGDADTCRKTPRAEAAIRSASATMRLVPLVNEPAPQWRSPRPTGRLGS